MRSVIALLFFLFVASALPAVSNAQELSPEMVKIGEKLDRAFDQNLKGWKRERVAPVDPRENVIVEFWNRPDRRVKISIVPHASVVRASEALAKFARYDSSSKKLEGIGDEAFSWGYSSEVAFRHGNVDVFISAGVNLNLLAFDKDETSKISLAETVATNRLVACFVNLALGDELDRSKRPRERGLLQRPCEQELARKGLISLELFER
jgi:hypothetical protein